MHPSRNCLLIHVAVQRLSVLKTALQMITSLETLHIPVSKPIDIWRYKYWNHDNNAVTHFLLNWTFLCWYDIGQRNKIAVTLYSDRVKTPVGVVYVTESTRQNDVPKIQYEHCRRKSKGRHNTAQYFKSINGAFKQTFIIWTVWSVEKIYLFFVFFKLKTHIEYLYHHVLKGQPWPHSIFFYDRQQT